jgi:hypothetical protein
MKVPQPKNGVADGKDKELIETFRIATYGAILGAFVQGFGVRFTSSFFSSNRYLC